MREIKFRAWVNTFSHWHMTNEISISHDGVFFHGGQSNITNKEWKLLQYTGLKDKNGTEIYEGDILTSNCYPFQDEGKYNYHGIIEWIDELASFYMTKRLANSEKRGMSDGLGEQIENIETFEVIGNIYENPELLNDSR